MILVLQLFPVSITYVLYYLDDLMKNLFTCPFKISYIGMPHVTLILMTHTCESHGLYD